MQAAPVENAHQTINQKIDEAYIQTIEQAAALRDYLDDPKGAVGGTYRRFKNPFFQLFLLTRDLKEMRECGDVSAAVEKWANVGPSDRSAREGLRLFSEYQRSLFANLIISRRDTR